MELYRILGVGSIEPSRTEPHRVINRQVRRGIAFLLLAFVLSLLWFSPAAAADGALDPTFDPGAGVKKIPIIRGKINFPDGSYMIYGYFTTVNGSSRASIAIINANGTVNAFSAPVTGEVRHVEPLANGQFLIGGSFGAGTYPNNYYNLARLNSNGTLDASFTQCFDYYGAVNSLAVQSNGKILVGGYSIAPYSTSGTTFHLLRLSSTGSLDTTYSNRSAAGGYVSSVKLLTSDFSRIFGTLPRAGGPHVDYVLVLNSTGGAQSNIGDEVVDGPILNLGQQSDKLIISGQFQHVSGVAVNRVARLYSNLTLDPTFNIGAGPNGSVMQLTVQGDGKVALAGNFTSFNGTPCGYLVRLGADGAVDTSFNFAGVGADDVLFHMKRGDSDTGWWIAGAFRAYNGTARTGLAGLTDDGALDGSYASLSVDANVLGTVYALARQSDGKLLIGGDFTGYRGKYRNCFARLNADGTLDTSFTGGIDGSYVKSIAIQPDGKILLAGYFGAAQKFACTSLSRLNSDSSFDTSFKALVTKLDGSVSDLRQVNLRQNGQIMVAGHFRTIDTLNRTTVARLNANGALDTNFDAQVAINLGTGIQAYRLAEVNGKYLVGGYATYDTNLRGGFLTRLTSTGAMDTTFGPTTPSPNVIMPNDTVKDLALQKDGRILACGDFTEIRDGSWSRPQRGRIARFTADGLLDPTFTTDTGANSYIEAMALQPNDKILIGGNFTGYNLPNIYPLPPPNRNHIARVLPNGNLDTTFNPGTGVEEPSSPSYKVSAYALLRLASGKAVIGGYFTLYNGTTRNQLAQVFASPANSSTGPLMLLLLSD